MSAHETPPHAEIVDAHASPPEAPAAATVAPDPARPRARRETRTVGDVVREVLMVLTASTRARSVTVSLEDTSTARIRDVRVLRRSLLVIVADTIATSRRGGVVTLRTRDLAGGRLEIVIEDASEQSAVVDRAFASHDRSGRASTLRGALEDLERAHSSRVVAEVAEGRRRVLMDVAVPIEP